MSQRPNLASVMLCCRRSRLLDPREGCGLVGGLDQPSGGRWDEREGCLPKAMWKLDIIIPFTEPITNRQTDIPDATWTRLMVELARNSIGRVPSTSMALEVVNRL